MKHIWTTIKNFLFGKKTNRPFIVTPPLEQIPYPYRIVYNPDEEVKVSPSKQSQTDKFIDAIQAHGKLSYSWMAKNGIKRGQKIVSELRKKGWEIKTTVVVKDGAKDVVYSLIQEPQPIGI